MQQMRASVLPDEVLNAIAPNGEVPGLGFALCPDRITAAVNTSDFKLLLVGSGLWTCRDLAIATFEDT